MATTKQFSKDELTLGMQLAKTMLESQKLKHELSGLELQKKEDEEVDKWSQNAGLPLYAPRSARKAILLDMATNPNRYAPTDVDISNLMLQQGLETGPPVGIPTVVDKPITRIPDYLAKMLVTGESPLQQAQGAEAAGQSRLDTSKAEYLNKRNAPPNSAGLGATPPRLGAGYTPEQAIADDIAGLPVPQLMEMNKTRVSVRPSLTTPGGQAIVREDWQGNVIETQDVPIGNEIKWWKKDPESGLEYGMKADNSPAMDAAGQPIFNPIAEQTETRTVTQKDGSVVQESVAVAGPSKGKVVRSAVVTPAKADMPLGDQASNLMLPDGTRPKPTDSMQDALTKGAKPDPKMTEGAANKTQLATTALQELDRFEPLLQAGTMQFATEYGKGKLGMGGPMASWRLATENAIRIKSGAAISNEETTRQAVEQYPMFPWMTPEARMEVISRLRSELQGAQRLNDPTGVGTSLMTGKRKVKVYDPSTQSFREEER